MWRESRFFVLVLALVIALMAAACSSSGDDAPDDEPVTAAQCEESDPDCEDTATVPDDESLPPDTSDSSGSSGMIVDGGISLGEALAYEGDEPVAVQGWVVIDAEGARLCEALAESFPPQCGGAHLDITNPEVLTDIPLEEAETTQWSPSPVTLIGDVNANEFTVDELSI